MKIPKTLIVIAALLAVLVALKLTVFAPRPDDQRLIEEALAESIQASREGRPGGVMDKLSHEFKVNGESPGSRWDIAKFIRDSKPEVEVENTKAFIDGDTARINTPVRVNIQFLNQRWNQRVENVTLVFKREDSRKWLILPSHQWRLTDVVLPPDASVNLPQWGGGGLGLPFGL